MLMYPYSFTLDMLSHACHVKTAVWFVYSDVTAEAGVHADIAAGHTRLRCQDS